MRDFRVALRCGVVSALVISVTSAACTRIGFGTGKDAGAADAGVVDSRGADMWAADAGVADLALRDAPRDALPVDAAVDRSTADSSLDLRLVDFGVLATTSDGGACPWMINDTVIDVRFDHDVGGIYRIIFKQGSNTSIVAETWNESQGWAIGRLRNETGARLVYCGVANNAALFRYVNSAYYESKTLFLRWDSAIGLEIETSIVGLKAPHRMGSVWQPGGDIDANDRGRVIGEEGTVTNYSYTYPGRWTVIWSGRARGVAIWDEGNDEAFGYRYDTPIEITIASGAAADGPQPTLNVGNHAIHFAVKRRDDLLVWISP